MSKKFLIALSFCCVSIQLIAQTYQAPAYILDDDKSSYQDITYIAEQYIQMNNGFGYDNTGGEFNAFIQEAANYSEVPLWSGANFDAHDINQSLSVGVTAGSHGVSPSGAASYSIPIAVPSGTNGIQPSISVNYSSQAGNGLLGYGWNLAATSVISRMPKTVYHNGKAECVQVDNTDWFAIDGNRLMATSGAYGASGTQYGKEIESDFVVIESKGISSNGPEYFTVTHRNGTVMEYGRYNNSRISNSGGTGIFWYLNKVTDVHGNYMEYFYDFKQNELFLDRIEYTANSNENVLPYAKVEFKYLQEYHANTTWMAGKAFEQTMLLDKIVCSVQGVTTRKYEFSYGDHGLYSQLTQVQEFGINNEAKNPTIFQYGENGVYTETSMSGIPVYANAHYIPGDYNNDGYSDVLIITFNTVEWPEGVLVSRNYSAWKLYLFDSYSLGNSPSFVLADYGDAPNHAKTYFPNVIFNLTEQVNESPFGIIDFNGDGYKDFYFTAIQGSDVVVYPYLGSSGGFSAMAGINTHIHYRNLLVKDGDFNGDGKSDIFLFSKDYNVPGQAMVVNYGAGGFTTIPTDGNLSGYIQDLLEDVELSRSINFEGDADEEILCVDDDNILFVLNISFNANNTIGFSNDYSIAWWTASNSMQQPYLGDYNGDGITDIITKNPGGYWQIGYGRGGSFSFKTLSSSFQTTFNGEVRLTPSDINADGKTDLVRHIGLGENDSRISTFLSEGYDFAWTHSETVGASLDRIRINGLGNYTNDNQLDYFFSIDALPQENAQSWYPYVLICNENANDRNLLKVKNGHNNEVEFVYDYMHVNGSGFYELSGTSYADVSPFSTKGFLVKEVKTKNSYSSPLTTSYTYKRAQIHPKGRGFLGFQELKVHDHTTDIRSTSVFTIDGTYFYPKLYSTSSKYVGLNEPISSSVNAYYNHSLAPSGGKRYFSYVNNASVTDTRINSTTQTTQTISSSGLLETSSTFTGGKWTTSQTYTYSGGYFQPSSISTTVSETGVGSDTRVTAYTYTPKHQLLTEGFNDWLYGVSTTYTYNDFGNLTLVKKTGFTSETGTVSEEVSYGYDATQRFRISITIPGLGTSYATYDQKREAVVSTIGVNGLQSTSTYDGFGRVLSSTDPLGNKITTEISFVTGPTEAPNAIYRIRKDGTGFPEEMVYFGEYGEEFYTKSQVYSDHIKVKSTYNNKGQLATQTMPYKDGETVITKTYSYHPNYLYLSGETTSGMSGSMLHTISYNATAHTITSSSQSYDGKTTTSVKDARGKVIKVTDNLGQDLEYEYDLYARLYKVYDDGKTHILSITTYDKLGHQISLADIDAGTSVYYYDALGRLVQQFDSKNNRIDLFYDNVGRIISRVDRPASGTLTSSTTTYVSSGVAKGNIQSMSSTSGISQSFTYDDYGRVATATETVEGTPYTYSYTYDSYGREASMQYPTAVLTLHNTYDANGFLIAIKNQLNHPIWSKSTSGYMNGKGQWTSYHLGSGITVKKEYDNYGRPTLIKAGTNATFNNIQELSYSYYDFTAYNGNLEDRNDNLTAKTETFTYDGLDRLKNMSIGASTETMLYDVNGNITTKPGTGSYTYDATKIHAVTSVSNTGGLIDTKHNIGYNTFNSVSYIQDPDLQKRVDFTYGLDQQRKKAVYTDLSSNPSTAIKTRYYLGNYEKEIDHVNGISREVFYISTPAGFTGMYVKEKQGTTTLTDGIYYAYTDPLGSIVALTNASGINKTEQNFDAWGRRRDLQTWAYTTTNNMPAWSFRGYTGHESLEEFDLINMNGRLYDPLLGRMLSPDNYVQDATSTQGYNRYAYALNNPVKYTDPSGEIVFTIIGALLAPVTGGASLALGITMDVGGSINLLSHVAQGKINSVGDALVAYGIGSAAGAVGYATGGAAFAAFGGGAAGAGGFLAGFMGTAVGSAFAIPVESIGNSLYFGDPMMTPGEYALGIIGSGLLGGTFNGISALKNGREFLDGTPKGMKDLAKAPLTSMVSKKPEAPYNSSYNTPSELQVPDKLYHYTYDDPRAWNELGQEGKTLHLTPDGDLNRLTATYDLDLPRVPRYRIEISTSDPNFNLSNIQLSRPVNGNFYGHGGAGWEILYNGTYQPSGTYNLTINKIW